MDESISNGLIRELDALTIRGLQFQHVEKGLLRFKFVIPEHLSEEVEIYGKVVAHKDRLTLVAITITKKDSGELVAFAKQWMSSTSIEMTLGSSKL
ncbi:hypothetical protein RHMOL_Rhmol04G0207500 [Rhododendron molle]|uniref:Uncharacterized protein n=1 Tax=Rhododendron molle TaxID=49168 RepID=A0ACC0P2I4_RHOML|nr:hypothetical protein RHMOL_Rhmol04G0207500 [Rhododendron molle]